MLIRSRRPKRNRYLQIGLFFIIYTCYHAYSAAIDKSDVSEGSEMTPVSVEVSSVYSTMENTEVSHRSKITKIDYSVWNSLQEATNPTTTRKPPKHNYPTMRPARDNCTAPAIEQFPPPLMPASWRTVRSTSTPFVANKFD